MLLVTELAGAGPVARRPTWWDRIAARARSFTLDSALARGASPEGSVRLALRAQRLTGMRERRLLARGIRSLLGTAARPPAGRGLAAPVCRDRVRAAAREFEALAERLVSPAPVPAAGVAQASVLLHDGRGPLYWRSSSEDLSARVHQAVEALDASPRW